MNPPILLPMVVRKYAFGNVRFVVIVGKLLHIVVDLMVAVALNVHKKLEVIQNEYLLQRKITSFLTSPRLQKSGIQQKIKDIK